MKMENSRSKNERKRHHSGGGEPGSKRQRRKSIGADLGVPVGAAGGVVARTSATPGPSKRHRGGRVDHAGGGGSRDVDLGERIERDSIGGEAGTAKKKKKKKKSRSQRSAPVLTAPQLSKVRAGVR